MTRYRALAAILVLVALAACGADGVPERPEPRPATAPATQAGTPSG
jgi:predicted small lipoprotein YifL